MVIEITRKKLLVLLALLIVVVALPLTVYLTGRQQESRSRASLNEKDLLVTIGNLKVYRSDVKNKALEQYDADAIDSAALQTALNNIEEDTLLDNYAASNSLDFSDAEYLQVASELGLDVNDLNDKSEAKHELIKRNVIATQVKSRQVFDIGYWLPPQSEVDTYDTVEKANVARKQAQGASALTEIEQRLKNGEEPLDVAKDIIIKNPDLKDILSVNGYILSQGSDENVLTQPVTYTLEDRNTGQPLFDAIFSSAQGNVVKVLQGENSGGSVIKVMAVNNGQFNSYQAWLADQKQKSVKAVSAL